MIADDSVAPERVTIKRMWPGGPLRQFSDQRFRGSIPVVGGYAGAYVCDVYEHVTPLEGEDGGIRLHDGRWLCAPCGERHEQNKVRAARRMARLSAKPSKIPANLSIPGAQIDSYSAT